MGYIINGVDHEVDEQGYLLEAVLDDEAARVIAEAENIVLTDAHWQVLNYLNLLKGMAEIQPGIDSKALYDLFPVGPAKQGPKVAGLPQPLGKGGY